MSRPTDSAIARAWEEYCRDRQGHMVIITDAQFHVMRMARQFDAEAGGTDRQTEGLFRGMTFNESDAIQPDRIVVSQGGKHLATILMDAAAPRLS